MTPGIDWNAIIAQVLPYAVAVVISGLIYIGNMLRQRNNASIALTRLQELQLAARMAVLSAEEQSAANAKFPGGTPDTSKEKRLAATDSVLTLTTETNPEKINIAIHAALGTNTELGASPVGEGAKL